jgi:FixJ family two-component response regulator
MLSIPSTVAVVDDDISVRESLELLARGLAPGGIRT